MCVVALPHVCWWIDAICWIFTRRVVFGANSYICMSFDLFTVLKLLTLSRIAFHTFVPPITSAQGTAYTCIHVRTHSLIIVRPLRSLPSVAFIS